MGENRSLRQMTVTVATAIEAPSRPDAFQRESAFVTKLSVFDSGSGLGKSPSVILRFAGIRCWKFTAWGTEFGQGNGTGSYGDCAGIFIGRGLWVNKMWLG
jgi:hypothetical protein